MDKDMKVLVTFKNSAVKAYVVPKDITAQDFLALLPVNHSGIRGFEIVNG